MGISASLGGMRFSGTFCILLLNGCACFPVTDRLIDLAVDKDLDILDSTADHAVPDHQADLDEIRTTVVNFVDEDEQKFRHHRRNRHGRRKLHWTRELLVYLHRYGYMDGIEDYSKENLKSRIASFQDLAGLKPTGDIDRNTIRATREPRCGNADLSPKDSLKPKITLRRTKRFVHISKWRNKVDVTDTLHLQWFIQKYTNDIPRDKIRTVVTQAFKIWEQQTQIPGLRTVKLSFSEAQSNEQADISIMWAVGDHGDDYAFDGNGKGKKTNILAHTFYPNYMKTGTLNGDIHLDDDEVWVLDNQQPFTQAKRVHFPYVLVHEIGHALGLGHSKRQEAVMNPIYKKSALESIELDIDDQCAINWNYAGQSPTCLYVWLLVELYPRAEESNASAHSSVASVYAPTSDSEETYSNRVWTAEDSFQEKLNRTIKSLADANIPQCTNGNDVQKQYETLLQNNLAFSKNEARKKGPVVCNFLDGFSKYRRDHILTEPADTPADPIVFPIVHSYTHANIQHDIRRRKRSTRKLHLHKHRSKTSTGSIGNTAFDDKFFTNLLKLFVERTNTSRLQR